MYRKVATFTITLLDYSCFLMASQAEQTNTGDDEDDLLYDDVSAPLPVTATPAPAVEPKPTAALLPTPPTSILQARACLQWQRNACVIPAQPRLRQLRVSESGAYTSGGCSGGPVRR